jgi:hypothetical protein
VLTDRLVLAREGGQKEKEVRIGVGEGPTEDYWWPGKEGRIWVGEGHIKIEVYQGHERDNNQKGTNIEELVQLWTIKKITLE